MKIVIIGNSGHLSAVLKTVEQRNDVELAGFAAGIDTEDCEAFIKKNIDPYKFRVFEDYAEMMDSVKPDIAVACSHFNVNASITEEALKRGIHVYCEKPIALMIEDLERVKTVHAKGDAQLAAMFELRNIPAFKAAYNAIRQGAIGEVMMVTAQKSYKLGHRADFFKKRESYGGTIPWVGIHAIDWVRWLSGKELQSVQACHDTKHNHDHGELETTALCLFEFQGGGFGSTHMDYLRPAGAKTHGDDRARVVGSKGIVEVIGGKAWMIDAEGERELLLEEPTNLFTEFIEQIQGKGQCTVSAEDSFRVTEIALKARQSADEGRKLNI